MSVKTERDRSRRLHRHKNMIPRAQVVGQGDVRTCRHGGLRSAIKVRRLHPQLAGAHFTWVRREDDSGAAHTQSSTPLGQRRHPALIRQERRKLPPAPGIPATAGSESPVAAGIPAIPAQAGSAMTGLPRRRSRVRVPSLPLSRCAFARISRRPARARSAGTPEMSAPCQRTGAASRSASSRSPRARRPRRRRSRARASERAPRRTAPSRTSARSSASRRSAQHRQGRAGRVHSVHRRHIAGGPRRPGELCIPRLRCDQSNIKNNAEDADHLITPEERLRVAMGRQ